MATCLAPAPPIFEDDLAAYVNNDPSALPSPPVFADRRWSIGGVVSLTPAPPPLAMRRASLGCNARCPPQMVSTPSSRWRARRYSFGPDSAKGKHGKVGTVEAENVDPQLKFVSTRRGGGLSARAPNDKGATMATPKTDAQPRERRRSRRSSSRR